MVRNNVFYRVWCYRINTFSFLRFKEGRMGEQQTVTVNVPFKKKDFERLARAAKSRNMSVAKFIETFTMEKVNDIEPPGCLEVLGYRGIY